MVKDSRLPVAVIGCGYLGRFHAQKYAALPDCRLVGVVDVDAGRAKRVGDEVGAPAYPSLSDVLAEAEALSIAVTTSQHHDVARVALLAGKHCLVEKPLAATVAQAQELVTLAARKNVVLQVGYLERFNPAFTACREQIRTPHFIESLRIHPFSGRGSDVDVVLDLMSHDLDLVLSLVRSPVMDLHAVGISLMTPSTDLANVRLMFKNGCVANLTASRVSNKAERKLRIFQPDAYFSLDMAAPSAKAYLRQPPAEGQGAGTLREEPLEVAKGDALMAEVRSFIDAVRGGRHPAVSGEDGLETMILAEKVMRDIARNQLP
jgi:predicted dehydrogenase